MNTYASFQVVEECSSTVLVYTQRMLICFLARARTQSRTQLTVSHEKYPNYLYLLRGHAAASFCEEVRKVYGVSVTYTVKYTVHGREPHPLQIQSRVYVP